MRLSLLSAAEQSQMTGIFAGQGIRGNGAGRRGADRSDLSGVEHANGRASFGIEKNNGALMRRDAAIRVSVKEADQLCAKAGARAHGAGHHSKQSSIGKRDDRAQELHGLASRESDHGLAHDWDAHLVGETSGNFFAINKSRRSSSWSKGLNAQS